MRWVVGLISAPLSLNECSSSLCSGLFSKSCYVSSISKVFKSYISMYFWDLLFIVLDSTFLILPACCWYVDIVSYLFFSFKHIHYIDCYCLILTLIYISILVLFWHLGQTTVLPILRLYQLANWEMRPDCIMPRNKNKPMMK